MSMLQAQTLQKRSIVFLTALLFAAGITQAQQPVTDSILQEATLDNVIRYAIQRQPQVQKALANEQITENTIKSKLADWFPQLNFAYNLQHNFKVQTAVIGGNPIRLGVDNTSNFQFSATQNIFNRDVLLASRTAEKVRLLARQNTGSTKIDIAVDVAKAFYDVLATRQQIKVTTEDTIRLARSLRDAFNQYQAGITDKTDYKRATIALNNTRALLKSNEEALKAKLEYLKALMNYPVAETLNIVYDTLQMEREIALDTLQTVSYGSRIEYQILSSQRQLQEANLRYQKWSYIPTVTASGAYNFNYQNNEFAKLYQTNYPNAFGLLNVSVPLFQGGKRKYNIRVAEWQLKTIDFDLANLRNNVNAEYAQALAAYKSNLASYLALKENLSLAEEVYTVIQLQYRNGVKTYLEVITSETDLRTARINYYNALYQVLSGKIDVQRALGQINY